MVEPQVLGDEEIEAVIQGNLDYLANVMDRDERFQQFVRHQYARARLTAKMRAFLRFENGHVNDGCIAADIHFVCSSDKPPRHHWQPATSGQFHLHQGFGRHIEMAHGAHADANGKLLSALLTNIASHPQHEARCPEPAR
jgi:thioesterase domain-containing protein